MATIELHDHQKEAVRKMHNGCVLWGGVGTGKTLTALAYAMEREVGRHVVVITTAKKRNTLDWVKEAAMLGFPHDKIEVDSWNNIKKFVDREGCLFIFDEQRLVGTGAWTKSFHKIVKRNRWILLSATPGDTWSDYAPLFIANGWYKNVSEFRKMHAVYSRYTTYPKIEYYVNEGLLQKYRKKVLVEMPMQRHTTRHMHYVQCDYDRELLDIVRKRRWNVYEDKPLKNAAELFGVMRKVVSSDQDRVTKMEELVANHPRLIVFYNFDYELEILREICQKEANRVGNDLLLSYQNPSETTSALISDTRSNTSMGNDPTVADATLETNHAQDVSPSDVPFTCTSGCPKCTSEAQGESLNPSLVDVCQTANGMSSPDGQTTFSWAEYNGHKHQDVPTTDRWVYLVQYMSGAESWNCTETDAMVFWSLTYSWKQWDQSQGRIDRMNTPFNDLHYYAMVTDSPADKPVLRALEQKRDFQPRKYDHLVGKVGVK